MTRDLSCKSHEGGFHQQASVNPCLVPCTAPCTKMQNGHWLRWLSGLCQGKETGVPVHRSHERGNGQEVLRGAGSLGGLTEKGMEGKEPVGQRRRHSRVVQAGRWDRRPQSCDWLYVVILGCVGRGVQWRRADQASSPALCTLMLNSSVLSCVHILGRLFRRQCRRWVEG